MLTRRTLLHSSSAALLSSVVIPRIARGGGDSATVGAWSPVYGWPCVAIHLHLLPNTTHLSAKILSYGNESNPKTGKKANYDKSFVVEIPTDKSPLSSSILVESLQTDLFCSGHTYLHDGRLIVMGGHILQNYYGSSDINIFNCQPSYSWKLQTETLNAGRWYPSIVTMPSGDALVMSGSISGSSQPNPLPQIWRADGSGMHNLTGALLGMKNYPKIFVISDGRVIRVGAEPSTMFLDTAANAGTGKWSSGPKRKGKMRGYGVAVMYDDGKFMTCGGAANTGPTNTAELLDLNVANPQWRWTNSMTYARRHANGTLLPDGTVLVTGGSSSGDFNNAAGAILAAELWDPATERWTTLASGTNPRIYHSSALLLPDGRVLWTGGGSPPPKNGKSNTNAEIFSPPYLFKGARPDVTSVPASASLGSVVDVVTPDKSSIRAVNLLRIGSVTHTFNMNQRINRLSFTTSSTGVRATLPSDRNRLVPGHYLLFAINDAGVPSIGRMLQVTA